MFEYLQEKTAGSKLTSFLRKANPAIDPATVSTMRYSLRELSGTPMSLRSALPNHKFTPDNYTKLLDDKMPSISTTGYGGRRMLADKADRTGSDVFGYGKRYEAAGKKVNEYSAMRSNAMTRGAEISQNIKSTKGFTPPTSPSLADHNNFQHEQFRQALSRKPRSDNKARFYGAS